MNKIITKLETQVKSFSTRLRRLAEDDRDVGGGQWKTVNGRHVLVRKGETPLDALKRDESLGGGRKNRAKLNLKYGDQLLIKGKPFILYGGSGLDSVKLKGSSGAIKIISEKDLYKKIGSGDIKFGKRAKEFKRDKSGTVT